MCGPAVGVPRPAPGVVCPLCLACPSLSVPAAVHRGVGEVLSAACLLNIPETRKDFFLSGFFVVFFFVKDFLFVGCLTSQQHVSVSQGRICSDKFTCCHTEIQVAD